VHFSDIIFLIGKDAEKYFTGGHMIKKILVAVDGSDIALKAVKYSVDMAKQTGAALVLLSVIDDSALIAQYVPAQISRVHIPQPIGQYMRANTEKIIEKAVKLCGKHKVKAHGVIRNGRPVDEILREARKSKADMIVIGSRGKGSIESAVLGSVTYGVIHKNTKYPVLVIR
jgi:nucleotide-binding universal stress UspA family protein